MTMVVTEPCFGCKNKECLVGCPVECFHEGESMLFIDPEMCIECDQCVSQCPVEAIFQEDNVPSEWLGYIDLNREMAEICPGITE